MFLFVLSQEKPFVWLGVFYVFFLPFSDFKDSLGMIMDFKEMSSLSAETIYF